MRVFGLTRRYAARPTPVTHPDRPVGRLWLDEDGALFGQLPGTDRIVVLSLSTLRPLAGSAEPTIAAYRADGHTLTPISRVDALRRYVASLDERLTEAWL